MDNSDSAAAGMKILLLDDSAPLRSLLAELLEDLNVVEYIVQAEDVPSTLAAFEDTAFDVAILDLNIPGQSDIRNGIDLARVIKRRSPATRIALLTALANSVDRVACMEAGADRFYDKSQVDNLLDWVLEAGSGRQAI